MGHCSQEKISNTPFDLNPRGTRLLERRVSSHLQRFPGLPDFRAGSGDIHFEGFHEVRGLYKAEGEEREKGDEMKKNEKSKANEDFKLKKDAQRLQESKKERKDCRNDSAF